MTILQILAIVVSLMVIAASPILFAYLVSYAARHKIFATFVQSETIELVGAGSDEEGNVAGYVRTLPNVTGHMMVDSCNMVVRFYTENHVHREPSADNPSDRKHTVSRKPKEITIKLYDALIPREEDERKYADGTPIYTDIKPEKGRKEISTLWEQFLLKLFRWLGLMKGDMDQIYFRWVSLWYFWKKVGKFRILKARIRDLEHSKGVKIRDTVETDEETVNSLLWKSQRPVLVQDVDLYDRSRCDILVNVVVQFIVPRIPVFVWKHRFYPLLDSAISAAVIDFCRYRNYAELVSHVSTGPSSEFFQRALSQINAIGGGETKDSLVKGVGVQIVTGWIAGIELSKDDQDIQKAAQAKEIAKRRADGRVAEAEGIRKAKTEVAEGERVRLEKILSACNGNVDLAIQYLKIDQRSATPQLATLIEADAKTGTVISIPANDAKPTKGPTSS